MAGLSFPRSRDLLLTCVLGAVACAAVAPRAAAAGPWSADPRVNLALADRVRDQVQAKLAPTMDGGFYVSWYDDAGGGYDPTLQRLDEDGVEQWRHDGIALADTGFSWVTDYSLAVTAEDDALVAFRDDRGGAEHVTIVRVTVSGAPVWGASGINVDSAVDFIGPPKIVSTADDDVVVAWTHDKEIRLRRLDLAGKALWPSDIIYPADPGESTQQYLADLQPTPDGGVIVSWVHTASFYAPRHLRAQKFSRDGRAQWGDVIPGGRMPLVIFDAGTLQYGNFPPLLSDGDGGAVFAWYETDPVLQVRVQRVRSDGTLVFAEDGALTTAEADPSVERVEPAMTYDPLGEDIYVFWREMYESGPLDQWVRAQRFAADGSRRWGDLGLEIEGHGPHEVTQLEAEAFQGGVLIAYVEKLAEGDQRVWIRYLDEEGKSIWRRDRVAVSGVPSGKSRLDLALSSSEFAALGWQDTRGGSEDIYVQNVNADASLGPMGGPVPTSDVGTATPTAEVTGTTPPTPLPATPNEAPTNPPTSTGGPTTPPTTPPTPAPTVAPERSAIYLPVAMRLPAWSPSDNVEAFAVAAAGDTVYLGRGTGMAVIDVRDRRHPHVIGRTGDLGSECRMVDVALSGTRAFPLCLDDDATVTSTDPNATLFAVDVRDPWAPRMAGSLPIDELGYRVDALDDWAYLAGFRVDQQQPSETRSGTIVLDLATAGAPRRHGLLDLGMMPFDQIIDGDRLVTVGAAGREPSDAPLAAMRIVDLAQRSAPVVSAEVQMGAPGDSDGLVAVAVADGVAYAHPFQGTARLYVVDTASVDGPRLLAMMTRSDDDAVVRALGASGEHLVALVERWDRAAADIYLEVWDPPARDDLASGDYDSWIVGEVALPGVNWRLTSSPLAVAAGFAYVAVGDAGGMAIVDLSEPAAPEVVGTVPPWG